MRLCHTHESGYNKLDKRMLGLADNWKDPLTATPKNPPQLFDMLEVFAGSLKGEVRLAPAELRAVVGTTTTAERAGSSCVEAEPSSSTVGSRRETRPAPQRAASEFEALVAPDASLEKQSIAASSRVAP
ncbi:uncharacterized protein LOC110702717 [Chenopodium quinoa]|uniref:uncharacterized protein LOC110702717 n=1 Tax=Chenopodium quinoa TaxID=63459 RepID=UPI000B78873F|nr:uncharacterized protein LOC110702717 [Chenopodium quinoa]